MDKIYQVTVRYEKNWKMITETRNYIEPNYSKIIDNLNSTIWIWSYEVWNVYSEILDTKNK